MAQEDHSSRRKVRSFVLRTGRITAAQEQALQDNWPRYGLKLSDGAFDAASVFGNANPVVFEIGFGMGDSLLQMAQASPDKNFVGVEVHTPGVGRLLAGAAEADLNNLRVYQEDALDVLEKVYSPASIQTLQLFFPDPWPKKRHHKRRIVQPEFLDLLHSRLQKGGVLHIATDWEPYAEHCLAVISAQAGWENCAGEGKYSPIDPARPITKFETRGKKLGHGVWELKFATH